MFTTAHTTAATSDTTAAELNDSQRAMMLENTKLAHYLAIRYAGTATKERIEDMTGIAMVQLAKCCTKFDPALGKFGDYAAKSIRGALTRANKQAKSDEMLSMDSVLSNSDDDDTTWHDVVSFDHKDVTAAPVMAKSDLIAVEKLVAMLDARERRVIRALYWENLTLRDLATELGISHTYVATAHKAALRQLETLMQRRDSQPVVKC